MKRARVIVLVCAVACLLWSDYARSEEHLKESPLPSSSKNLSQPDFVVAARREAKLLHETIHAMLQMVHARYFHKDDGLPLPATSFKMVFKEIEKSNDVKLHWLAVNLPPMHLDHKAKDDFEKAAVKSLSAGSEFFEQVDGTRYRYAGSITMGSECLSCHSPTHTSNEPRIGGLVIGIELQDK